MLYLTLLQTSKKKISYSVVLINQNKTILKKIGVLSYNIKFNKFILTIDLFLLFLYFKKGIYFSKQFYLVFFRYINFFFL